MNKLDVTAEAERVKKGLGMAIKVSSVGFYDTCSTDMYGIFHNSDSYGFMLGTYRNTDWFEISYLCIQTGNKYSSKWNLLFWIIVLWGEVDSAIEQLKNRRDSGLISLILFDQISKQMAFEIMTTVAF